MSESDIVRGICDYLALKKHFFWRQNTAPTFDTTRNQFRAMPAYSKRGVPDIILVDKGIFIGLEVKQRNGYQSEPQKEFSRGLLQAGGKYHVVRSIEDVIALGL